MIDLQLVLYYKNNNIRNLLIFCLFTICSLFAVAYLGLDNEKPIGYEFIFLIPIGFIFAMFLLYPVIDIVLSRVSTIAIIFIYFLRTVLIPILIRIGNYESQISIDQYNSKAFLAILLVIYETIFVFAFIRIKSSILIDDEQLINTYGSNYEKVITEKKIKIFKFLLIIFVVYVAAMLIRDPSLLRSNFILLVGTPSDWKIKSNYVALGELSTGGTLGILVTVMNQVIGFITVFVPPLLALKISKKKGIIKYIMLFLLIAIIALVGTEERFRSIDYSLALIFTIRSFDNNRYKKFTNLLIVAISVVVFIGLLQKGYAGNVKYSMDQISSIFSSYFSSIPGVAAAIEFSKETVKFGLLKLPTDIISHIPYVKSVLSSFLPVNTGRMFNYFLTGTNKTYGQIISSIALGYVYFGFVFSPIIPVITVSLSMKFDAAARESNEVLYKNLYYAAAIVMARCCGQCNFLQGVSALCNIIIMYLLIVFFYRRNNLIKKANVK